ncbi:LacI family DNA-binding transcriptional regulator [Actomonas aquatica]|uniref:LacI family DNA-binding transcriptional regulator n=1 Tax=Actomonas aquatica TaxID=2866162 RepID=A0ABZ1CA45_9BACT|nr:LacI family DNA-binding transcriptional regulator [Opitutus sp. WL0086]WRQ88250.1 LacI family DNA-binding transcriptional regulator [Opitutus sp. WL0086]
MPSKATLQDVANAAGVHRTTVSLALRDHPRIPAATRERVKAVANQLGYRINPLVAALMQTRRLGRRDRHVTLAFVTSYPTRYGWRPTHHDRPNFFPGAAQRAQELGYKLEDFWLAEPGMTSARFCRILASRGINGLLIGRLPPGLRSLNLDWNRFSCVALGLTLRSPVLHHVTENHFDTAAQAMQRCVERGYRRIGFVYSEANDSPSVGDRWLGAYLLHRNTVPKSRQLPVCPGDPTDEAKFAAWFRRHRPDAIIANHIPPLLPWLARLQVSVPDEVGLVGLESHSSVDCAGVRYDPAVVGALAVDMLVGLLHRNETGIPQSNQHEVLLTGVWHEGQTLPPRC